MRFITGLIRYKPWRYLSVGCLCLLFFPFTSFAQPVNNDCANASIVNISNSGFGLGEFTCTRHDIEAATLQAGETFAASFIVHIRISFAKNRFYDPINQCYGSI